MQTLKLQKKSHKIRKGIVMAVHNAKASCTGESLPAIGKELAGKTPPAPVFDISATRHDIEQVHNSTGYPHLNEDRCWRYVRRIRSDEDID